MVRFHPVVYTKAYIYKGVSILYFMKQCKHEKRLSLYGRAKNNWISTIKFRGNSVYICEVCGSIIEDSLTPVELVKGELNSPKHKENK